MKKSPFPPTAKRVAADSTLPNREEIAAAAAGVRPLPVARKLSELIRPTEDTPDPAELLRHRFLCRGGGLLLAAPTGVGKSVWELQMAICWAIARTCFGIIPARAIRSLIIQAENDEGDLAEMRDGIIEGLNITPVQAKAACNNVIIVREDTATGLVFWLECVRPLLAEYKPDLVWIDPALSYLGGEANSQRDVGGFLRNGLNPLLREFNCGAGVVHHTNKPPSGKEKPEWSGSDFAYLGAGSAEWANWARAVLAIRATGQDGVFELRAGKRGSRLGWKDEDGNLSFNKHIAHSRQQGVIYWRECESGEISTPGRPKEYDLNDLLALLPPEGFTSTEWQQEAKQECGIRDRRFYQLVRELDKQGRAIKSKVTKKWQPIQKRA